MIRVKKLSFVFAILLMATTIFSLSSCGGGGSSESAVTLKLASDAPEEHIATGLNNDIAKKVEEQTDGRVKVEYYPASQLGSYESVYKEVVMGSIDIAQITIPDATEKKFGATYLPYYAKNYEEAKILFGPDSYMVKTMKELTAKEEVRYIGVCLEGFIGMGTVKEVPDVFEPNTKRKFKMRSPGMATFLYVQEDLGLDPTTITYAEVPTAIQTGVVDGWIGGTPNMNYSWVGDVINYMYVNYIHAEATSYVMSEKSLAKLSEEDQKTVISIIEEASDESFVKAEENEKTYKEKLANEKKVKVVEFTPEQVDKYAEYVREKTWTRLEKDLGADFIDNLRKETTQFD